MQFLLMCSATKPFPLKILLPASCVPHFAVRYPHLNVFQHFTPMQLWKSEYIVPATDTQHTPHLQVRSAVDRAYDKNKSKGINCVASQIVSYSIVLSDCAFNVYISCQGRVQQADVFMVLPASQG